MVQRVKLTYFLVIIMITIRCCRIVRTNAPLHHGKLLQRSFSTIPVANTEIERKFECNETNLSLIKEFAFDMKKIKMVDMYYDDPDYSLSRMDYWLRKRNDDFELKWPQTKGSNSEIDSYYESTDHHKIMTTIEGRVYKNSSITDTNSITQWLSSRKLEIFGRFITHRTRYCLQFDKYNVFVDIDDVLYEPNRDDDTNSQSKQYTIGEIELHDDGLNDQLKETEKADIMTGIMAKLRITPKPVRGKVLEFLKRFRPNHYNSLKTSGQLSSKGL